VSTSGVDLGIEGLEIGHWTDSVARTGCTVVVLPPGTVASGEVRGGAPATRDFELLEPGRLVEHVDAVVLSGGSAFGLAAADGVVRALEADGRGFPTAAGPVPIVVGLSLFDLGVGDGTVRPDAESGRQAFAGRSASVELGAVGAGAGATIGKWAGPNRAVSGGLGMAEVRRDDLIVMAVVAVNCAGDIDDGSLMTIEQLAAGTFDAWPEPVEPLSNTTIGVVVTNAALDKSGCLMVAQGGHDGLARAIVPAHTRGDGDAIVAAATGAVEADVDHVRLMAVAAVVGAVRSSVATIQA
jgi:L-aminopeptidase/D-esterase-like protein